jgi:hypothetical protein
MIPFACIHCRTKRIKTNLTLEKEMKSEEKKEKKIGGPNGPLGPGTLRVPRPLR